MRRVFLSKLAGGMTLLILGRRAPTPAAAQTADPSSREFIAGKWHLLGVGADEVNVPQHRMDLRFRIREGALEGVILSRTTGAAIPLATASFDGSSLRLQMQAPGGRSQAEMPTLVMTRSGDRMEGHYVSADGQVTGLKLKLIRARH